jgi:hypothetical protein
MAFPYMYIVKKKEKNLLLLHNRGFSSIFHIFGMKYCLLDFCKKIQIIAFGSKLAPTQGNMDFSLYVTYYSNQWLSIVTIDIHNNHWLSIPTMNFHRNHCLSILTTDFYSNDWLCRATTNFPWQSLTFHSNPPQLNIHFPSMWLPIATSEFP